MALNFVNETETAIPQESIKKCVDAVLKKYNRDKFSASVVFTTEQNIKKLNKIYRGKNKYTDVLSFPQNEDSYEGDIIISPAYIKKNLKGKTFEWQICHAALHGTLHLLGRHHDTPEEQKQIHKIEEEIINKIL